MSVPIVWFLKHYHTHQPERTAHWIRQWFDNKRFNKGGGEERGEGKGGNGERGGTGGRGGGIIKNQKKIGKINKKSRQKNREIPSMNKWGTKVDVLFCMRFTWDISHLERSALNATAP